MTSLPTTNREFKEESYATNKLPFNDVSPTVNNRLLMVTSLPTTNREFNEASYATNKLPFNDVSPTVNNRLLMVTSLPTTNREFIEESYKTDNLPPTLKPFPVVVNPSNVIFPPNEKSFLTINLLFTVRSPPTTNREFKEASYATNKLPLSDVS